MAKTLGEFFDPYNPEHLAAYRHLEKTGAWPEGFLSEDIYLAMHPSWNVELVGLMAQAWLKHMEENP